MVSFQSVSNQRRMLMLTWALLILIVLAGAALRLWRLAELPPGLFFDEAYNGLDARAVAEGRQFPLYFTGNNGREPLYIYLQALFVALFGPTAYALRFTSALIGIVTIPLTFFAARALLPPLKLPAPARIAWPALIAAAGLAISFWHVSLSRLAFRAILLPPLSLLAVAFFWRAWRDNRRRDYIWSGVWFGLALYSYIAARLLPLVVVLFVLVELAIALFARAANSRTQWRSRAAGLGWLTGAGLVVCLPLLWTFSQDPALLGARTGDVSIFTAPQSAMPGTPAERLLSNGLAIARSLYDRGDLNLRHNLPGRPVQDWLLAALFTLGWLGALWRLREPQIRLLLLWFGVMAVPSLLSTDAPHALRMAGMLPPLALLYGVGTQCVQQLALRRLRPDLVGALIFSAVLLVGGTLTARDYFARWSIQPELGEAFSLDQQLAAQTLATHMAEDVTADVTADVTDDGAPLLITRRLFLTPQMRFALGDLPVTALAPDELAALAPTAPPLLSEENPDPAQPLYLLHQRGGEWAAAWVQTNADWVAAVAEEDVSALAWPGQQPGWAELRRAPLPADLALQPGAPRYALDVTFANGLQLVGYDVTPDAIQVKAVDLDAAAAEPGFLLTTYWRLLPERAPPSPETYDLFAHLLLPDGAQVQENGNLGQSFPVELWQPGQVVDDRRTFAVPPAATAGRARFEIGLYDPRVPAGAVRIPIVDGSGAPAADHVTVGAVAVAMAPPQAPVDDLTLLDARFDEQIGLVGWRAVAPEDDPRALDVTLAWQALTRPAGDYTAFVHLLDAAGEIVAQFDQPPGGPENPTVQWLPDERVRADFPLRELPPLGPDFSLRLGLYEPVSGRQLSLSSVNLSSAGDAEAGATFVRIPLEAQP